MKKGKNPIGDRMKEFYENRTRQFLPRRTYTIIRIDGKAFHTYTKGLEKPFDHKLISDMDQTAKYLCENIQGAKLAYVQSDEISILMTDFDNLKTDAWFNGNVLKIASISSSYATAMFNSLRPGKLAHFDSRTFTIPTRSEVSNYFLFRFDDCIRNSISSMAQSTFSHKELNNKSVKDMKEMCRSKDVDWDTFLDGEKFGRFIVKENYFLDDNENTLRSRWVVKEFTDRNEWENYIPNYPDIL